MKRKIIFSIIILTLPIISAQFLALCNGEPYTCTMSGLAGKQPYKVCFLKDFLMYRSRFDKGDIQTSLLFYGPPGTGKTVTLQSISQETGALVKHYSGASLITEWQNSGVKTIKDIYEDAEKLALGTKRPVIIFIDEVDAISKKSRDGMHEAYKNTFLELIQQIHAHKDDVNVITILATNKIENIDEALISRVDLVEWELPAQEQREEILRFHAKNFLDSFSDEEFKEFSRETYGFSGRDLENVIRFARFLYKRNQQKKLYACHVKEAIKIIKEKIDKAQKAKTEQEEKQYDAHYPYKTDKAMAINQWAQTITIGTTVASAGGWLVYQKVQGKSWLDIANELKKKCLHERRQGTIIVNGKIIKLEHISEEELARLLEIVSKEKSQDVAS